MTQKSWMFCTHANECPQACPCPEDCICKEGMCRERPRERRPERWEDQPSAHGNVEELRKEFQERLRGHVHASPMGPSGEPVRWKDYDGNGYDMGFEHAATELRRLIGELVEGALGLERLTEMKAMLLTVEEVELIRVHRKAALAAVMAQVLERHGKENS